eukprot:m.194250 g.194250  ORF g.194250 m.194250 type:complete len:80 (+) comp39492_c0_seq1:146-385(+)
MHKEGRACHNLTLIHPFSLHWSFARIDKAYRESVIHDCIPRSSSWIADSSSDVTFSPTWRYLQLLFCDPIMLDFGLDFS